jgi:hypothetical protein
MLEVLREAHESSPGDRELLLGFASLVADQGDIPATQLNAAAIAAGEEKPGPT